MALASRLHRNGLPVLRVVPEAHGLAFEDIESFHVAADREHLLKEGNPFTGRSLSKASIKQHLATIRGLYDWLIVGSVLPHNPTDAVRGPKLVVKKGKTPILDEEQAKELLESSDDSPVVGLRGRAPVSGRVMLRTLNLDGDRQIDLRGHGGPFKAVCVYTTLNSRKRLA